MLIHLREAGRRLRRVAVRHPFVPLPFVFYYLTASRTIGMSDTAILINDIQNFNISTAVNSHNLTVVFGKLFSFLPFGSLAFRGNLLSVFFGGLTIALFYLLIHRCFRSRLLAAMTASLLMVSHSMWWHSALVESYAINACLMTVALHLLVRYHEEPRELYLLALIGTAGISVFQHVQLAVIGLAALVVATAHVMRLLRDGTGRMPLVTFLWRAGLVSVSSLVPYAAALALDIRSAGGWSQALSAASGGEFRGIMFEWASGLGIADTLLLTLIQFPSPFLLMVVMGVPCFLQRWKPGASSLALLTMFVVNTGFFAFYHTWDRFAFLLVSFLILAFWSAFAADQLLARAKESSSWLFRAAIAIGFCAALVSPPWLYAHLTDWRASPDSLWGMRFASAEPHSAIDFARYNANPNKRYYVDIEEYFDLLLDQLPPNAIYLSDDASFYTLEYYRFYDGRRPDIASSFVNSWGFSDWGLSQREFSALLRYAYHADLPLFLFGLRAPFDRALDATGRNYRFETVPLDAERSIYRLATAKEDGWTGSDARALTVPIVHRILVGYQSGDRSFTAAESVRAGDDFMVRFDFERNSEPFPVVFRWIAPTGKVRFSSPLFVVPADSGAFGWIQERRGVLTPGRWRVEVWVGASKVGSSGVVLD